MIQLCVTSRTFLRGRPARSIVALANTAGGVLLVGVEDGTRSVRQCDKRPCIDNNYRSGGFRLAKLRAEHVLRPARVAYYREQIEESRAIVASMDLDVPARGKTSSSATCATSCST